HMLDINWIKANPDAYDAALGRRGRVPFSAAELIAFDDIRRAAIVALEEAQARRNALSKQIGQAKAQKDEAKAGELLAELASLKETVHNGEMASREAEERLRAALAVLPNIPAEDVPTGADESANVEYFGPNGTAETAARLRLPKPEFSFTPREHFETGEALE